VLDGDPARHPLKGNSPQFLVHVHCGQTAEWTKMSLDMAVGLGPGHIVLDGDPAPPQQPLPTFGPCLLWLNSRPSQQLLSSCTHGPSANLECRSAVCCTQLAANAGPKKLLKIRHLGTIAQLCQTTSSQLRHVSTIGKKLVKQQCLPHISSQYGELPPTSG